MIERRFEDIWKEQCQSGRKIRVQYGIVPALNYLIGEKLLNHVETAETRPEFAAVLPGFVSELRRMFEVEELRQYMDHLDRMAVIDLEKLVDDPEEDDLLQDSADQIAKKREHISVLKELLTAPNLGTA